jgi:glycosyltransferase involved in cell wall biosynthesis
VVSGIAQTREVLSDDEACFVAVESSDALAGGVLDTLADPIAARARAERAYRTFCDRFTIAAVADQMVDFYRRALLPFAR